MVEWDQGSGNGGTETWSDAGEVQRQDLLMGGRQGRRGREEGQVLLVVVV